MPIHLKASSWIKDFFFFERICLWGLFPEELTASDIGPVYLKASPNQRTLPREDSVASSDVGSHTLISSDTVFLRSQVLETLCPGPIFIYVVINFSSISLFLHVSPYPSPTELCVCVHLNSPRICCLCFLIPLKNWLFQAQNSEKH